MATPTSHGGRILVIAEEIEVVDTVTDYLADLQYEPHGALAMENAAAIVNACSPDLVLLDIQTPRLTTVIADLRRLHPGLQIMVATKNAEQGRKLRALGALACHKPFAWDVLHRDIAGVIEATRERA